MDGSHQAIKEEEVEEMACPLHDPGLDPVPPAFKSYSTNHPLPLGLVPVRVPTRSHAFGSSYYLSIISMSDYLIVYIDGLRFLMVQISGLK